MHHLMSDLVVLRPSVYIRLAPEKKGKKVLKLEEIIAWKICPFVKHFILP